MEIINYLNSCIEWIDAIQLQFSAAYVYDNDLEKIKFDYIRFIQELMKMPSELKFMSSCLGSHLFTANRNSRQMRPAEITLFRAASLTLSKIRNLFSSRGLDFTKYTIGVMCNVDITQHIAGVIFELRQINGVRLIGVLTSDNYSNTTNYQAPKIKEVILREENVTDKNGLTEKRERIYVKYK
jgi:hypothetical protein